MNNNYSNMKVKQQVDMGSGIATLVIGLLAAAFVLFAMLPSKDEIANAGGFFMFPLIMIIVFGSLPIILGIVIAVKGAKQRSILKYGKKGKCVVFNILRTRNGYQMIVMYNGESSIQYLLGVMISYKVAAMLKEGTVIECYILGEDAYVDIKHIAIVQDDFDSEDRYSIDDEY